MPMSRHFLPVSSRPDKGMPDVRTEDGSDARVDPEDVLGQAALPSEGGRDSDAAEIRGALGTEVEESSLGGYSPFMQVGDKKVRAAFLSRETSNNVAPSHRLLAPSLFLFSRGNQNTQSKNIVINNITLKYVFCDPLNQVGLTTETGGVTDARTPNPYNPTCCTCTPVCHPWRVFPYLVRDRFSRHPPSKTFTGPFSGRFSRERLLRVRGYTPSTGEQVEGGATMENSGKAFQISFSYATLFRLRADSTQPVRYCIGVLDITAPPVDGEAASVQLVKGQLLRIRLVDGGDGSTLEWERRKLHTATTCTCSHALVVELDPTLDMSKKTYVFGMDELIANQNVLKETAESLK